VDLATGAVRRGDLDAAERLYAQALTRNPRSWRAAREAAEFWRHSRQDSVEALRLYEMAGANAPKQGADRALIFREWGILLRDSGVPDAAVRAEERLLIAFAENSTDAVTRHVLASCYDKRGAYRKVIELLEPVADTSDSKTRAKTLPYLLRAYEMTSELVKAAELRVSIARS
jgi:tetratricopeptide (TPR) repeat protein